MEFLQGHTITIIAGILIAIVGLVFLFYKLKDRKNPAKAGKTPAANTGSNKKRLFKANSVSESIPYVHVYENGVIETEESVYTVAFAITDINFKLAPEEDQVNILIKYGRFLNSLAIDASYQIVIQNKNADSAVTLNNITFLPQPDQLNTYRQELNEILVRKLAEGRNNILQEKFLVVSVKADTREQAEHKLNDIQQTVEKHFLDISREHPLRRLSTTERLRDLFCIYNQDGEGMFYNVRDKEGKPAFSFTELQKQGLTTKDVIGPGGMAFQSPNFFMLGNTYGRTLYLENIPTILNTDFIAELSDLMTNLIISIHYRAIDQNRALKIVHNYMLTIEGNLDAKQRKAFQSGSNPDLVSQTLVNQQRYARDVFHDMTERDQKMFFVTLVVTVFGDTKEQLEENVKMVTKTAANRLCAIKTLHFQQEYGLNSTLPLALNKIKASKMLTTDSASVFIPYTTQELHQKNGIYYGLNAMSNNLIVYNRLLGSNHNGLIIGESGKGKSFAAKLEMVSVLLRYRNSVVYVIDPEAEYVALAQALGGEVVTLSPSSRSRMNPLDMDIGYAENEDPIAMKTEFVISMLEIMCGNGRILTPEERTIVSRCCKHIYEPYIRAIDDKRRAGKNITCDKESTPTLNTLYVQLKMQEEPAAKSIATILEPYATGVLSTFASRTTVNTSAKFVVYDISALGTGTKNLGLHICLNEVWNKMIENEKKGIYTWFYADEFYLLLQSPSSANFVSMIWKRARKRKAVPTGILQGADDLLKTDDGKAILNNTSFIQILALKRTERTTLGSQLSIPDSQLEYLTDSGEGTGLLYAGKTTIPFNNRFPKGRLYDLIDTRKLQNADFNQRVYFLNN